MRAFLTVAAVTLLSCTMDAARAELFELSSGGRLRGEWLNREESPRETYVIKTAAGQVVLAKVAVQKVVTEKPAQVEYESIRPNYPDTVEGQWSLAEWCREHNLSVERKTHLQRVVELDPDHATARRLLGYSKVDGAWKTQEEVMTERGYVKYKGDWKLPQEIELLEERRRGEVSQGKWFREISRLRSQLDDQNAEAAAAKLRSIDDPTAIRAIKSAFDREGNLDVKILLMQALGNIGGPAARGILTSIALDDDLHEVRMTALDVLKKGKHPDVVQAFIQGLRSSKNHVINRAAIGLRYMEDKSAIAPLVGVLVTQHKFKVVTGSPGISTSFANGGANPMGGGSGFSTGTKTHIITQTVQNEEVLESLIKLSGANFGFNPQAWKAWLAAQREPASNDGVRRDKK